MEQIEKLKIAAASNPIEMLSTATTCIKGYSRCRFCLASGNFSIYGGQEWAHKEYCLWVEARKLVGQPIEDNL